jgi:Site-specific recombinases, DNA invertase Pin homologs
MISKIADRHLSREACIYIRQSTMGQVRFNQESTERQYNLASKAQSLGWSSERIRILDRDLGQSGARTTNREDFKTLVSDVAMSQVGAIFSLEASRLARSNQDWHRLLELCAITGTLVIDEDGCYDPAEFNDGLVLGMKGTFAQAELHIIRARLHGGKINKAHKGELHFALPVGFVFDDDKTALDPDQEVQGAVRTVFELFERESSAYAWCGASRNWSSLSASVVWRCLGWQTALGSTDPFAGTRYPGESILRRHLRVRAIPSLQADWADRRDPHSVPPHATG